MFNFGERNVNVKRQTIYPPQVGRVGTQVENLRSAALLFSTSDVKRVMDAHRQFPIAIRAPTSPSSQALVLTPTPGANDSLDFRFVDDIWLGSKIGIGNYDLMTSY